MVDAFDPASLLAEAAALRLTLDEEQQLYVSTSQKLFRDASPVSRLRTLRDSHDPDGFSRALWAQLAELGCLGLGISSELGGVDGGFFDLCLVLTEAGRKLAPEPFCSTLLLGARALLLADTPAHAQRLLPGVAAGETILAFAFEEAGLRYEYASPRTEARRDGEGLCLTGTKTQVLDGHVADLLLVTARGPEGLFIALVDPKASGVTITRQCRVDGRNAALVALDGVRVAPGDILAGPSAAPALLSAVLDRAAIGVAAEALGGAEQALDDTVAYLKEREQFGMPIGSFQALQHRAARLFMDVQLARASVLAAARAVDDAPALVPQLASLAKAQASEAFVHVAKEAIQMHGGIGMTDEHDIGFYLKRAHAASHAFGDAPYHRARWARLNGY